MEQRCQANTVGLDHTHKVQCIMQRSFRKIVFRRGFLAKGSDGHRHHPSTGAEERCGADIQVLQNFLCYSCKEYMDDLSKIPKEVLEPFCSLTGYPHDIYVDPERIIYQKLGMKREEKFTNSAQPSPHVKSGVFMGQMKSIWRAMMSPAFDFQGDLHQQGGAIIAGPGSQVHFSHFDMNRLDHMPINWLLRLAGVQQTVHFGEKAKVIHV
ncbi:peroxiredoxin-like 2C isoform X4 [Nerophis ophidion]|uniref:peroxiredoxin-like 2C isoform X4 n=1 Tax=Nerophis ophidion TaxID=159077 RepID=UPI002ADFF728|nr:peroxiredoxin-like 2C isoform X4 [Nerophis ophidion]